MNGVLEVEAFLEDLRTNCGVTKRERCTARGSGEIVDEVTQSTETSAAPESQSAARIEWDFVTNNDSRYIASDFERLHSLHQSVSVLELISGVTTALRQSRIHT